MIELLVGRRPGTNDGAFVFNLAALRDVFADEGVVGGEGGSLILGDKACVRAERCEISGMCIGTVWGDVVVGVEVCEGI